MNAIGIRAVGGPDRLEVIETDCPDPGHGELVIRVAAASVNRVDLELRARGGPERPQVFPLLLGCDCAGTVSSIGFLVVGFRVGDAVVSAACPLKDGSGTYAEYVAVPSGQVALKPQSLDWAAAAALPLSVLAASQAVGKLMPEPGEVVLINGASGGVGSFAIQLIKMRGARVIANARADAWQACRNLGANDVVDGRSQDLVAAIRLIAPGGVDAVLDLVDGATQAESSGGMRPGSRLVTLLSIHQKQTFKFRHVTAWSMDVKPNSFELAAMVRLIDAGDLLMPTVERFSFSDAIEAHEKLEHGGVLGKLVLTAPGLGGMSPPNYLH